MRFLHVPHRHHPYLRNEHGIKKFAEKSLGELILRVTKKSAFYREPITRVGLQYAFSCSPDKHPLEP